MHTNINIWDPVECLNDESYYFRIGPLQIWIERHDDEWLFAFDYQISEIGYVVSIKPSSDFIEKPEYASWHRIVAAADTNMISFLPVMAETPIVVGAEPPLIILPQNEALIFINVPSSIRVIAGTEKKVVLYELPSVVLSKTWVGSPVSGEVCLSLKTSAVRKQEYLTNKPNRVGCPVIIKNKSIEALELEKLCVHTENLGIYLGTNHLWTNKVIISYLGSDKNTEVRIVKGAPGMEENEALLVMPRIKAKDSFMSKSFDLFKLFIED